MIYLPVTPAPFSLDRGIKVLPKGFLQTIE